MIESLLPESTSENMNRLVEQKNLSDKVRGYGVVHISSTEQYHQMQSGLRYKFKSVPIWKLLSRFIHVKL